MSNLVVVILRHKTTIKRVTQVTLNFFKLLMCLKDSEDKGIEKEKSEKMEKSVDCPLCLEPLEMDDKKFFPCACGYQVCRFCWHRIRTNENGLCPACRRLYPENPVDFQPLTPEEIQQAKQEKKQKDMQKKQKIAENRKQLANIRVIQKNLVFGVGLPLELSQDTEKKEKVLQMFRQFGPTLKETITDKTSYAGTQGPGSCIYITYQRCEDAVRAVKSLSNSKIDGRLIKVSLGTTKYCSHFLKNAQCPKAECLYLHELAEEEASFTKEDIHLGKHYEYEQKLLEQTLNTPQNKIATPSSENNRINHNQIVDNFSDCSDEQNLSYSVQQNNSLCGSETSDLSPTSNSQNIENFRNIASDLQNETEKNHQNVYSANPDIRSNVETPPKQVFRSEESIIVNNHSTNSNFQSTTINPNFNNQVLQNESERLAPQPNFLSNQIYESALHCRGQSSATNESLFHQRLILPSSSSPSLVNDSGTRNSVQECLMMNQDHGRNSVQDVLMMNQEHHGRNSVQDVLRMSSQEHNSTRSNTRDDDPDLGFDPCEESLNGLRLLMLSEAKEKARIHCNNTTVTSRNLLSNRRSPTFSSVEPFDVITYKYQTCQQPKIRDPPPGFSNNCTPSVHYKSSYESVNMSKPVAFPNQLGVRTNFNVQRSTPPLIPSTNNSFLPDYTSTLSREIPDIIPPVLQQQQQQHHTQQRILNQSQLQYNLSEQRPSPHWNNTPQSQWRMMDSSGFNQSVTENRFPNEFVRMQARSEVPLRQWQQQLPSNVNNLSPFPGLQHYFQLGPHEGSFSNK